MNIMSIIEKHFGEYTFPESPADWGKNYETVMKVIEEFEETIPERENGYKDGNFVVQNAFTLRDEMDALAGKNQLKKFSFLYAVHLEYGDYFNIYA